MIIGGSLNIGQIPAFSTGGSLSFNGSNQYIYVANSAGPTGGSFTVECWFYLTSSASPTMLMGVWKIGGRMWQMFASTSGVSVTNGTTGPGGGSCNLNTWYHLAWVSNSTNWYMYLNGTQVGVTAAQTIPAGSDPLFIGANNDSASPVWYWPGNITNIRIVSGVAVYTGNFNPSSQPLTVTQSAGTNISAITAGQTKLLLTAATSGAALTDLTGNYSVTNGNGVAYNTSTPFVSVVPAVMSIGSLPVPFDLYFPYVTLLLSGDGANTAQNNTFTDGSTNNFTITRSGTPTQGSFSPYGSNWSNYFNGSTDYLTAANNAAFQFGTGDFTVEFWFNANSLSGTPAFFAKWDVTAGRSYVLQATATSLIWATGAGTNPSGDNTLTASSLTIALGVWNHVAITRTGTTQYIFLNGIQVATNTSSVNMTGTAPLTIGVYGLPTSTLNYFPGYISNFRIVKGTAVYTSTFIPSPSPLTAISGTSLLTCQSNRFIDNSTNNFALTLVGTPSVQRFSPFNPSSAYSTTVIGGSGYFNGSTDWLSTPSSGQFAPTGDFTIECWFNMTALPSTYYELFGNYNASAPQCWIFEISSAGVLNFYTNGGSARISTASGAIKPNTWYHVCMTRSGTTITGYINGVSVGTYTQSGTFGSTTIPVYIATQNNGSYPYNGYISDARLVDGTSVYTGNFVPSTAPLTAISGTKLLLNFINAGIYDSSMINDLITAGSAQASITQVKYGTASMKFNGTTDYLTIPSSTLFGYGSGDFTIEMWYYFTGTTSDTRYFFDQRTSAGGTQLAPAVLLVSGVINVYLNGVYAVVGSTVTTNSWNHLALVRSSGVTKLYINGSQSGSNYTDANSYVASSMTIGATPSAVNTYNWSGYIDDFRVTKGYARYTSNFTAPTSALPTQ